MIDHAKAYADSRATAANAGEPVVRIELVNLETGSTTVKDLDLTASLQLVAGIAEAIKSLVALP